MFDDLITMFVYKLRSICFFGGEYTVAVYILLFEFVKRVKICDKYT
jgi:hypothetical protein